MNLKTISAAALGALVAFLIGSYFGFGRSAPEPVAATPPPVVASAPETQAIASLRLENERLQAEVAGMTNRVAKLTEANAALAAQQAATPPPSAPVLAQRGPTIGLARWEVQQQALNNLRQIDAARKQHALDKGVHAGSITDLVGRGAYIKTVRTVDGEDYSHLSMDPTQLLTVTTPDGIEVTFDPKGEKTTRPEKPPEVVRVETMAAKLQPAMTQAMNAYQAANPGKRPPNEQALIPYFATPQEGADFTELLDARKAAGL